MEMRRDRITSTHLSHSEKLINLYRRTATRSGKISTRCPDRKKDHGDFVMGKYFTTPNGEHSPPLVIKVVGMENNFLVIKPCVLGVIPAQVRGDSSMAFILFSKKKRARINMVPYIPCPDSFRVVGVEFNLHSKVLPTIPLGEKYMHLQSEGWRVWNRCTKGGLFPFLPKW